MVPDPDYTPERDPGSGSKNTLILAHNMDAENIIRIRNAGEVATSTPRCSWEDMIWYYNKREEIIIPYQGYGPHRVPTFLR